MTLLKWALICLLISLVAGALGFTGVARGAAQISKVLFFIFLIIFIGIVILVISTNRRARAVTRRPRARVRP